MLSCVVLCCVVLSFGFVDVRSADDVLEEERMRDLYNFSDVQVLGSEIVDGELECQRSDVRSVVMTRL